MTIRYRRSFQLIEPDTRPVIMPGRPDIVFQLSSTGPNTEVLCVSPMSPCRAFLCAVFVCSVLSCVRVFVERRFRDGIVPEVYCVFSSS